MPTKLTFTPRQLAEIFRLDDPSIEAVEEAADRAYAEAEASYREALGLGEYVCPTETQQQDAHEVGEAAETAVWSRWTSAVESSVSGFLEREYGLMLDERPLYRNGSLVQRFEIVRATSSTWKDACERLVLLINGEGMFEYRDAEEFRAVVCERTWRGAFLSHLHWLHYHHAVYGTPGAAELYARAARYI